MKRALFLDRDGTLIVNRHYLSDPSGVELLPGARETLQSFLREGWLLFLFTNQSGVGRGMFTLEDVHRCNARMVELLNLPAPGFTDVCIAPETPEMPPIYRKPSPRFIIEMRARHQIDAENAWMVGDSMADVGAGLNAGIHAALIDERGTPPLGAERFSRVRNLPELFQRLQSTKLLP